MGQIYSSASFKFSDFPLYLLQMTFIEKKMF